MKATILALVFLAGCSSVDTTDDATDIQAALRPMTAPETNVAPSNGYVEEPCDNDDVPFAPPTTVNAYTIYVSPSAQEDSALIAQAATEWNACGFITVTVVNAMKPAGLTGSGIIEINKAPSLAALGYGPAVGHTELSYDTRDSVIVYQDFSANQLGDITHEIGHALGGKHWGATQATYPGAGVMCDMLTPVLHGVAVEDCARLYFDETGGKVLP